MNEIDGMIDKRDWNGIARILCKFQKEQLMASIATFEKMFRRILPELKIGNENQEAKDLLFTIVATGGRDFVAKKDECGRNFLNFVCQYNVSVDVISKLIEIGGRDLVSDQDDYGWNPLQHACDKDVSIEVISKLVEIGGRNLVTEKNKLGSNSLHVACASTGDIYSKRHVSIEILSKLIEVGGKMLVFDKEDRNGWNSLHTACFSSWDAGLSVEKQSNLLTQCGGAEILCEVDDEGRTPLDHFIRREIDCCHDVDIDNVFQLITKGIELQFREEYSIGGLFNVGSKSDDDKEEVKCQIYRNWDNMILPALRRVMALPDKQCLPILQAIIINAAPPRIIKDALNYFAEFIHTVDSFNKYPIDVAIHHGLAWSDGMKEIVEAFTSTPAQQQQQQQQQQQPQKPLIVCAKHGLRWENGMKEVLKRSHENDIETRDKATGLYPCMLAAVGKKYSYDLDSVFCLIRKRPLIIHRYDTCTASRKRKRR